MNLSNITIRLLTVLSYLLPFVFFLSTCTSQLTSKDAYNKADAILNEQEKIEKQLSDLDLLLKKIDSNNIKDMASELRAKIKSSYSSSDNITHLNLEPQYRLLMPTDHSLSAIGSIWFHKNILGKTAISLSLALSLIIMIFYQVLGKRKIAFQTISANIIALIIFIADNLLSNVTTLYGTWTLLFLLLIQLATERQKLRAANH
jgi:hypothetical protein